MTGTDLCVNKPVTVPVIFEPPCIIKTANSYMFPPLLAHHQGVQSVRPKHVAVSGVHNVIVFVMQLCYLLVQIIVIEL